MRAFLRWRKVDEVLNKLYQAFEKWLGFVHIYGFPLPYSSFFLNISQEQSEKIRQELSEKSGNQISPLIDYSEEQEEKIQKKKEISDRLNIQLKPGQAKKVGNYIITAIEDDGLLQLGRVALAVISHLPRRDFLHAIATGLLAEEIMGKANNHKGKLFAWLFRSSSESLWNEVREEAQQLISIDRPFAKTAAYYLLWCEGSQEAYETIQRELQHIIPRNLLLERHQQDPCNSGFAWSQAECEQCLPRNNLNHREIAMKLKQHCL